MKCWTFRHLLRHIVPPGENGSEEQNSRIFNLTAESSLTTSAHQLHSRAVLVRASLVNDEYSAARTKLRAGRGNRFVIIQQSLNPNASKIVTCTEKSIALWQRFPGNDRSANPVIPDTRTPLDFIETSCPTDMTQCVATNKGN